MVIIIIYVIIYKKVLNMYRFITLHSVNEFAECESACERERAFVRGTIFILVIF